MQRWLVRLAAVVLAAIGSWAAPASAADSRHGKQLFQAYAACHGGNGQGGSLGPKLMGSLGDHGKRESQEEPCVPSRA